MSARQEFVSTLEHAEVGFPFDEVIIVGHTADRRSAHTIGANINVDIYTFALHRVPFLRRYRIMENIGMGLLIRYVRGVVDMRVGRDRFEVDLGGLQLTAGLRFRF